VGSLPERRDIMAKQLEGLRVAALMEDGFEEVELVGPAKMLRDAGVQVDIVSPKEGTVRSWTRGDWGDEFAVDVSLKEADAGAYDGLLMPGGVRNPDHLRRNPDAWRFVQAFFAAHKPVAAICHAPWTLIDAGVIDGRRITSYHTLQTDLKNAGADWVDRQVVVDRGLITSRAPKDIPAFARAFITELARSRQDVVRGL
jgi:deglycase